MAHPTRPRLQSLLTPLLLDRSSRVSRRPTPPPPPNDARDAKGASDKPESKEDKSPNPVLPHHFKPEEVTTTGSITAGGSGSPTTPSRARSSSTRKGWDDVSQRVNLEPEKTKGDKTGSRSAKLTTAEASMFYVAYFKEAPPPRRGPSRSSTTAAPARPPSGCTWARSGRGAS